MSRTVSPTLEQVPRLTQALWQGQIQTVTLLAMTTAELARHLEQAAEENPVIEVVSGVRRATLAAPPEVPVADRARLADHLWEQVPHASLAASDEPVLRFILDLLDQDGYLRESSEAIAALAGATADQVARLVALIRTLEPKGVGARNLPECLEAQLLAAAPPDELALAIVRAHLEDLAGRRYNTIARATGQDVAAVRRAAEAIQQLDPRPGQGWSTAPPNYVRPDLEVALTPEGVSCQLTAQSEFHITVDTSLRSLMSAASQAERAWLDHCLQQGRQLSECLRQRRTLLLAVAQAACQHQRAFFERGPAALKPLTMTSLAAELGLSVSTVSRAVRHKTLHCQQGTFELRVLFPPRAGASQAAAPAAKSLLRQIIAAEPKSDPFSDQALAAQLGSYGVRVSRRTVARYRSELGLPGAAERASA
ncbi:MAG: RNA polymerase factor sigma-54 [Propionibacteriaceae bacterium]|jgi:RNA polymerase sigma-54 factor|nr:RNA polymerase factor sigma-54 [Propionibacteriaceae bacterium]